jgi:hypothetical protein
MGPDGVDDHACPTSEAWRGRWDRHALFLKEGGCRHAMCLKEGFCAGLCCRLCILAVYPSALNLPLGAGLFS